MHYLEQIGVDWVDPHASDKYLKLAEQRWGIRVVSTYDKYTVRTTVAKQSYQWINRYLPEISAGGLKLLDMSTGPGIFLEVARTFGNEVLGTNEPNSIYRPLLESQGTPYLEVDGTTLPYPFDDCSFDVVTLLNALHFFPQKIWLDVLDELFRISKKVVFLMICEGKDCNDHVNKMSTNVRDGWVVSGYYRNGRLLRYDRV